MLNNSYRRPCVGLNFLIICHNKLRLDMKAITVALANNDTTIFCLKS